MRSPNDGVLGATCSLLKLVSAVGEPLCKIAGWTAGPEALSSVMHEWQDLRDLPCGETTVGQLLQCKHSKEKNHPPGLAWDWSVSVRPRTDPWRGCGWCPWTAPLIIDIKRRSGTRGLQLCRCKPPPKPAKLHDPAELFAQQAKSVLALLAPKDVTETRLGVGRVS